MTSDWKDAIREQRGVAVGEHFNVVLVYGDQASARRGLALYQRLVSELGGEGGFSLTTWTYTVLGVSRLADISPVQAAEADLVIVCTQDESESPEQVQACFQQYWLELNGHSDCALVVLDGTDCDGAMPDRNGGFFHDLARHGQVTVFTTADRSAARMGSGAWLAPRPIACAWQSVDDFSQTATARSHVGIDLRPQSF